MTSDIRYVIPDVNDVRFYTQVALDHKLYVHGWMLFEYYTKTLDTRSDATFFNRPRSLIGMAYDGTEPIACVFLYASTIGTYVKVPYRRKGIGTKLLNEFIKHHRLNDGFLALNGIKGSVPFYEKSGIPTTRDNEYLTKLKSITSKLRESLISQSKVAERC